MAGCRLQKQFPLIPSPSLFRCETTPRASGVEWPLFLAWLGRLQFPLLKDSRPLISRLWKGESERNRREQTCVRRDREREKGGTNIADLQIQALSAVRGRLKHVSKSKLKRKQMGRGDMNLEEERERKPKLE